MPELPELEAIAYKLTEQFKGVKVHQAAVLNHLVLYNVTMDQFQNDVEEATFTGFRADGKFLIIEFDGALEIVVNPMLTGRFKVSHRSKKPTKSDIFALRLKRETLWYNDRKQMGRVYLVRNQEYSEVAEYMGRGPSALDPDLSLDEFKKRLLKHRGQIKNVLRNQKFVKGIGNAYVDEILLYAGILPFRKKSTLSDEEVSKLFGSMRTVLEKFREILFGRTIEEIGLEKRDFMMIHGKGNGVCPLCGNRISEVKANRFKTNYCQKCQV